MQANVRGFISRKQTQRQRDTEQPAVTPSQPASPAAASDSGRGEANLDTASPQVTSEGDAAAAGDSEHDDLNGDAADSDPPS